MGHPFQHFCLDAGVCQKIYHDHQRKLGVGRIHPFFGGGLSQKLEEIFFICGSVSLQLAVPSYKGPFVTFFLSI